MIIYIKKKITIEHLIHLQEEFQSFSLDKSPISKDEEIEAQEATIPISVKF